MDVFAVSSDTEQMPLPLLEAMAAGKPVAATAMGDVVDMLALENRRFAVARDDAARAGAIGALLDDAGLRRAIGRRRIARTRRWRRPWRKGTILSVSGGDALTESEQVCLSLLNIA